AQSRALVWLRSEGYYEAEVTPETRENPVSAHLLVAPGPRFSFNAPQVNYLGAAPSAHAAGAVSEAIAGVREGAPARAATVLTSEAQAVSALQNAGYA